MSADGQKENPAKKSEPRKPTPEMEGALDWLTGEELEAEKTRSEVKKLRVELTELKAWRSKLYFTGALSVLTPLFSVVLFLAGWFVSHESDRKHQSDEVYARAAAELSSTDASVRLSAVITLGHFAARSRDITLSSLMESLTAKNSIDISNERPREAMAQIIGRLSIEDDPAVLDEIENAVQRDPQDSIAPLISMNKTAAVQFARAAGAYSGLSILRKKKSPSADQDEAWRDGTSDRSLTDLVYLVRRTGSPFEGNAKMNQQFASRNFIENNKNCPFRELFKKEQALRLSSEMNDVARTTPPDSRELNDEARSLVAAAARLERSSIILGELVERKWSDLNEPDLFGTAIVIGDLKPGTIANIRARGGYFTSPEEGDNNPGCRIMPSSARR